MPAPAARVEAIMPGPDLQPFMKSIIDEFTQKAGNIDIRSNAYNQFITDVYKAKTVEELESKRTGMEQVLETALIETAQLKDEDAKFEQALLEGFQ